MSHDKQNLTDHKVVHKKAPLYWKDGFPLGNGVIGIMAWGDGNPLAFTLDHADLWDLRSDTSFQEDPNFNYAELCKLINDKRFKEADEIFEQRQLRDNPVGPTKISIGRAELKIGRVLEYECALDLSRAVIEGTILTDTAEHKIQGFVHHDRSLLCLRLNPLPEDAEMRIIPLAQMSESLAMLEHPKPRFIKDGNLCILLQEIPDQLFYAIVWNSSGPDFFLAVETAESSDKAISKAKATWDSAFITGFENLYLEHIGKWREFWEQSAVFLPEKHMEFLWYYGLYLLASSARCGSIPPGLQGLWAMDEVMPPWRGDYHADMNVQETFWPACASGHLDLLDSWCDYMKKCIEPAREFTRKFFGTEGTFWPACTIPWYTIVPCWHTVQFGWSHTGWLGWLVWLRWRYSMDMAWLAETGYPLIADIFKFYRANLKEEADGRLHIPLSNSPEYRENSPGAWCKDPNIDIALIRRCCDWIVEMEDALGVRKLADPAHEIREKLVPYSITEQKVLCLWPGKVLDQSHRHPSHLMAIHPAMDLAIDKDEETQAIINSSVEQYLSLGQYFWVGHTYAQLISHAAVLGRAGLAYDCLMQFVERWVAPNGLHFNRDLRDSGMSHFRCGSPDNAQLPFTMEASCAVSAGISDMLVQGWGDTLRIFPAVPPHWRDIAFRDLRTEGAFQVSAIRLQGKTVWVKIRAGADRTLRLNNPFDGDPIIISGHKALKEGKIMTFPLKKGEGIILQVDSESLHFDRVIELIRQSNTSFIGLR